MRNVEEKLDVSDRIKVLIDNLGVSQSKFAEDVKMSKSHLNMFLNKKRDNRGTLKGISDEKLKEIADYYKISFNYLKSGTLNADKMMSAQKLMNTMKYFNLENHMMTDDDIALYEEIEREWEENKSTYLIEIIEEADDSTLRYLNEFLEAISLIDSNSHALVNMYSQLNKRSKLKADKLIDIIPVTQLNIEENIKYASVFGNSEEKFKRFASDYFEIQEADRLKMINNISQKIEEMDKENISVFYDFIDQLVTLDDVDYSLLKKFKILDKHPKTTQNNLSVEQLVIIQYVEDLLELQTK